MFIKAWSIPPTLQNPPQNVQLTKINTFRKKNYYIRKTYCLQANLLLFRPSVWWRNNNTIFVAFMSWSTRAYWCYSNTDGPAFSTGASAVHWTSWRNPSICNSQRVLFTASSCWVLRESKNKATVFSPTEDYRSTVLPYLLTQNSGQDENSFWCASLLIFWKILLQIKGIEIPFYFHIYLK